MAAFSASCPGCSMQMAVLGALHTEQVTVVSPRQHSALHALKHPNQRSQGRPVRWRWCCFAGERTPAPAQMAAVALNGSKSRGHTGTVQCCRTSLIASMPSDMQNLRKMIHLPVSASLLWQRSVPLCFRLRHCSKLCRSLDACAQHNATCGRDLVSTPW